MRSGGRARIATDAFHARCPKIQVEVNKEFGSSVAVALASAWTELASPCRYRGTAIHSGEPRTSELSQVECLTTRESSHLRQSWMFLTYVSDFMLLMKNLRGFSGAMHTSHARTSAPVHLHSLP